MRQVEAVETLRYQDGQKSCLLFFPPWVVSSSHGKAAWMMVGLVQSLIPCGLRSCCSRWVLTDSCKAINRKMKSVGEAVWKRHFNYKAWIQLSLGILKKFVSCRWCFCSWFLLFFWLFFQIHYFNSMSHSQFFTVFLDSVVESFRDMKSVSQAGFWSSERWLVSVYTLPLTQRITVWWNRKILITWMKQSRFLCKSNWCMLSLI